MSFLIRFTTAFTLVISFVLCAVAETHMITIYNGCGYGTPTLRGQDGNVLSTGEPYTSDGPIGGLIAYLQDGSCGANGEGCTLVEATLVNGWSSADISLIPPHEFSGTAGFGYWGGCDGVGTDCTYAGCATAFYDSNDNSVQVGCAADDVNLAITFCD